MAKRKLSKQQTQRVQTIQAQQTDAMLGQVIAHHGKFADILYNDQVYHCKLRQNLGDLVVGDEVYFEYSVETIGVVTAIGPRKTKLLRMTERGQEKLIAANIDQVFIVMAATPAPSWLLLDGYLAAAHYLGIKPILVFNKMDLGDEIFEKILRIYQSLNVLYIKTSVVTQEGITELKDFMKGSCSIFVGQSGVGKSSLLKTLLPCEAIEIGDLHDATGLGTHTTSTSRLYVLKNGAKVIDSPGIRDFSLWAMTATELTKAFVEFEPYLGQCKFRDCSHNHEPDCAIQRAVANGKIALQRLQNYHSLLGRWQK